MSGAYVLGDSNLKGTVVYHLDTPMKYNLSNITFRIAYLESKGELDLRKEDERS